MNPLPESSVGAADCIDHCAAEVTATGHVTDQKPSRSPSPRTRL